MYDSKGCKYGGEEIEAIITYLFDYVEDSTHLITTNPIACYGSPYLAQAQSIGYGNYTWHVGDWSDSVNYSTWVAADSVLVADYYTPPMTESTWISVDFSDQHGCVTHDSVWVEVDHPEVAMTGLPEHLCVNGSFPLDLAGYTTAAPDGGSLYYYGQGLSADGLFTPTVSGSYELYANYTDPLGCVARDTATVGIVEPEPLSMELDTLMFTDLQYTVTAPADGILTIDGVAIPGTDGQYVIDPGQFAPGYYTLHFEAVYGDYDCLSEFETVVHIVDRTRVRDFDVAVSVYPNPATTLLNLSCTEPLSLTVTLSDITGRALRTEPVSDTFHTIDVTALPSGVYLLRMATPEGKTQTVKFVKR
jgi:hypothetical protein